MHELNHQHGPAAVTCLRHLREPSGPADCVERERPAVGPPGLGYRHAPDVHESKSLAREACIETKVEVTDTAVALEQRGVDGPKPETVPYGDGAEPKRCQGMAPGMICSACSVEVVDQPAAGRQVP